MNTSDYKFVLKFAKKIILLSGRVCKSCGNSNLECLDFHHVIGEKEKTISELCRSRLSMLIEETKKCVVLCKNCHINIHFPKNKNKHSEFKKKLLDIKGGEICSKCKCKQDIASLDFHHRKKETKDFNLSNAYGFLTSKLDKIVEELDKCDVLCRNCHATEHFDKEKFERLMPEIEKKIKSYKELRTVSHSDVKKMHSDGLSNAEISRQLHCSEGEIVYIFKKYRLKTNTVKECFPKEKVCLFCKNKFNIFDSRAMKNRKYCSWKCMHDSKIKLNIPKNEFENMLKEKNISVIAKLYNVSTKAVTNLAIRYDIRKKVGNGLKNLERNAKEIRSCLRV